MTSVNTERIRWLAVAFALLTILAGCSSQTYPTPIPPANQFTIPAVGTLIPAGHEETVRPDLSPNVSGVLFVNQSATSLQVVVSNTIASIPAGKYFLFILPPGTFQFFIYQPNMAPRVQTETIEGGKLRYVYVPIQFGLQFGQ